MGRKQARSKSRQEKPIIDGISNEELMHILENVAAQLGVLVRHEKGDFHSAGCRVVDQKLIILKKTDKAATKAGTLLQELAKFDTNDTDMPQAVRDQLAKFHQRAVEEKSAV